MSTEISNISQTERQAAVYDLIYLLGCAVNETAPDPARVERMNLEEVYACSRRHSLTAISCMALEDAFGGKLPQTELFAKWTDEKNRAIYKNLLFDMEREQLFSFLEEAGIWHMPLKGILLKNLYPKPGMRQMADQDILFDEAFRQRVRDWFAARGYETVRYRRSNHDVYQKKPVYNFEMHVSLFGAQYGPVWEEYYANTKERMLLDDHCRYRYHLSDEDFYIYMITHACKHHSAGGTGLRSVLDCYVYCQAKGEGLDWAYVHAELEKLGVAEFEEQTARLSRGLFASPQQFSPAVLTEEEAALLGAFAGAGTYGTLQNRVSNRLKAMGQDGHITRRTKLHYVWKRLFPDMDFFRAHYPFVYRHKWLVPFTVIYRIFYKGIKNRRRLGLEVRMLAGKNRRSQNRP